MIPTSMLRDETHKACNFRIAELECENAEVRACVKEWLCEQCNTVYPGPPQKGCACVQCPKCLGRTGPRTLMENRKLRSHAQRVKEAAIRASSYWPNSMDVGVVLIGELITAATEWKP